MAFGNHSALLARCLGSVRPIISSYVLIDSAATDNSRAIAANMLRALEGRILGADRDCGADLVPLLYAEASRRADYVLFMHPDETFVPIHEPTSCAASDVLIVEIDHGRCSFMQPRLVRSGLPGSTLFPFRTVGRFDGELVVSTVECFRLFKQSPLDGKVRIPPAEGWHSHVDVRAPGKTTPQDCVERAIHCSKIGNLAGACDWLLSGLSACDDSETEWQLYYLLGLSCLDVGNTTGAIENFSRAFELDSDRLEPLHQLVRIKMINGDLQSAAALSRLALDIDVPTARGYLERKIYDRERYIQHIVILERMRAFSEAREACESLLRSRNLGVDLRRYLEKSRMRYAELSTSAPSGVASASSTRTAPLITVGMAVVDDYNGVYFTVMTILSFHRECLPHLEFLVIDNNPGGVSAAATKRFCEKLGIRYVPVSDYRSTAVRDSVFRYANGRFVLCMDSHVMLQPGSLERLIDYIHVHPDSSDLLQGPLVNDSGDRLFTHLECRWSDGMYGVWAQTEGVTAESPPFEIPMQGLGLFCCRMNAWPGLNPRFTGFGGEEGYLHEKFRRSGGKVLCLPFLQWAHRFDRPQGIPYPINWQDRIRNYLIGHDELGLDTEEMATHFARVVDYEETSRALTRFLRERDSAFYDLDAIYFLDHDIAPEITEEMSARFKELGVSNRIRRRKLGRVRGEEDLLVAVGSVLEAAATHAFSQVFVISSLDLLPYDLEKVLGDTLDALGSKEWSICFLGLDKDPDTGLPMESGIPGLMRVHRKSADSLGSSMCASGTFLVNVRDGAERIRAWLRLADGMNADGESRGDSMILSTGIAPACYALCPPATVRRDRFSGVRDPARYCSMPDIAATG